MHGRLVMFGLASLVCLGCDGETSADAGAGPMDAATSADGGGDVDGGSSSDDAGAPGDGGAVDGGAPADAGDVDGGRVSMPCMATGACDPFDPMGCPAGQKCRVLDTGTECQDLTMTPPLGVGAACASELDCGPGLWCVNFAGSFECTPMCPEGSIGACGADAACIGTVGTEACVRACRPIPPRCDIYAQDCADGGDRCTLTSNPETGENYTGCRENGTLALDEPCGGDLGRCARGLICIREGMATTCRQVCGPDGAAPTCGAGECTGLARSWGVPYCR